VSRLLFFNFRSGKKTVTRRLERFELGDASPEDKYAAYRSNPEWKRIYSFLHDGYWHVTSAWDAIRESGAIKPNIGGRFPMKYGDRHYAYHHQCIALFDFVTPSEEEVIQTWGHACDVLSQNGPVLLRLDRSSLDPKVIPNRDVWGREDTLRYLLIPFIEAWYPGEISTDAITAKFRLTPHHGLTVFRPEPFRD
jgi:hypothetical protein